MRSYYYLSTAEHGALPVIGGPTPDGRLQLLEEREEGRGLVAGEAVRRHVEGVVSGPLQPANMAHNPGRILAHTRLVIV